MIEKIVKILEREKYLSYFFCVRKILRVKLVNNKNFD